MPEDMCADVGADVPDHAGIIAVGVRPLGFLGRSSPNTVFTRDRRGNFLYDYYVRPVRSPDVNTAAQKFTDVQRSKLLELCSYRVWSAKKHFIKDLDEVMRLRKEVEQLKK
jgi:hypothetical protein